VDMCVFVRDLGSFRHRVRNHGHNGFTSRLRGVWHFSWALRLEVSCFENVNVCMCLKLWQHQNLETNMVLHCVVAYPSFCFPITFNSFANVWKHLGHKHVIQ
jgi:hypothetical protein